MTTHPDWKSIEELPKPGLRPGRQFVMIEGWCEHDGTTWKREYIGDALTDKDGPQGYRASDIDRLLRDGDMDGGAVRYWAPFGVFWPTGVPTEALEDGAVGKLVEALEELIEVADLRGDTELPHPSDSDEPWTARMQTAWDEIRAALAAWKDEK